MSNIPIASFYSIATLGTRTWKINPDKEKQVALVDSLCKKLNVTAENVEEMFTQYITPYCVLEFETPYWQDIADFLHTRYNYNPPQFRGALMSAEEYQKMPLVPKTRSIQPLPASASLKNTVPFRAIKDDTALAPLGQVRMAQEPSVFINKSVEVLKDEGVVFLTDLPYQCDPDIHPFPDPDRNISALLDFESEVAVSIPDETQYIQMDETAGEDYLCISIPKRI